MSFSSSFFLLPNSNDFHGLELSFPKKRSYTDITNKYERLLSSFNGNPSKERIQFSYVLFDAIFGIAVCKVTANAPKKY